MERKIEGNRVKLRKIEEKIEGNKGKNRRKNKRKSEGNRRTK